MQIRPIYNIDSRGGDRAFASHAEGWVFESKQRVGRQTYIVKTDSDTLGNRCKCHGSMEMTIINGCPVSQYVWHAKEHSLLNGHECRAWVKFAALRRNEVAFHGRARQNSLPAHCNSQWDVINQNMDIVVILLIKKWRQWSAYFLY